MTFPNFADAFYVTDRQGRRICMPPNTAFGTLMGGSLGVGLTAQYFSINGKSIAAAETAQQVPMPVSGFLKNFYARVSVAPGAGVTRQVRFRLNGVNVATVTIVDPALVGQNVGNVVQVNAGDLAAILVEDSGGVAAAAVVSWSCQISPV